MLREVEALDLIALGGLAVSQVSEAGDSVALWATDGSAARTVRLQMLPAGRAGRLTTAGDQAFFALGDELWVLPHAAIALPSPRPCPGDCDGDGAVAISGLVSGADLALGRAEGATACGSAFCAAGCGAGLGGQPPPIACLLRAVNRALETCRVEPCVTDGDCDDGNGCSVDRCTENGCASDCACV